MLVIMIGNRERRILRFGCRCIFLKRNSESSLDTSTSSKTRAFWPECSSNLRNISQSFQFERDILFLFLLERA